jgi:hypothetical protein
MRLMSTTATASPAPTLFLHFTTLADALLMVAAGVIGQSRTIVGAVYGTAVGGRFVPCTQLRGRHAIAGREDEEMVAILFTADEAPDCAYVEEVIWYRDSDLPVTDAEIITLDEAIALLDETAEGLED